MEVGAKGRSSRGLENRSPIALDATLIRLVLVPAIMQLMGNLNWWLPGVLHGLAGNGATFGEGEPTPVFTEELELAS